MAGGMKPTRWNERFWASTRGRIIQLLRRSGRTVNELAGVLGPVGQRGPDSPHRARA